MKRIFKYTFVGLLASGMLLTDKITAPFSLKIIVV